MYVIKSASGYYYSDEDGATLCKDIDKAKRFKTCTDCLNWCLATKSIFPGKKIVKVSRVSQWKDLGKV